MTLPLNLLLFSHVLDEKTITPTSYTAMNDLTTPGFYYVKMKQLNSMTYNLHLLVSANDDSSRVLQLLVPEVTDDENTRVQIRLRIDGTWTEWKRLMTDAQVDTRIDQVLKQHGLIK